MPDTDLLPEDCNFSTIAIHAADSSDFEGFSKPVVQPISLSATYERLVPGEAQKYIYSRADNPSRKNLETTIAALDGGKYGLTFSSGMNAINSIVQLLRSDDHVICMDQVYGGTDQYFNEIVNRFRIDVSFVDLIDIQNLDKEMKSNTKLIWLENPTNPLMKIIDIRAIVQCAKSKNPDVIVVVDNTFLTSYFQKPLSLGADISMYSLSKYMNGHADVVMGAAVTNSETLYSGLKFIQFVSGGVPSPFDCFLVERGLKTLSIRMKQHMKNGLKVAEFLESHPMVLKVQHPGLKSHPGYKLAKLQWSGYSGILSFYLKGNLEDSKILIKNLKYFVCAASVGGFESLIGVPCLMSHSDVEPSVCEKLGITENLIRLSVGLESAKDLIEDLNHALLTVQMAKKKQALD